MDNNKDQKYAFKALLEKDDFLKLLEIDNGKKSLEMNNATIDVNDFNIERVIVEHTDPVLDEYEITIIMSKK